MMTGSWLRVPAPDLGSLKIIQKMQPPNHQMKYTAHRKSSGLIFGLLVIRSSSWDPHLISRYCRASPGLLFNQRLFWSCFVNIPNLRQDPSKCLMSEPDAGNFGLSGRGECFDIDTRNQNLCHRHYSGEMWEIMQHPWPTIVITDWVLLVMIRNTLSSLWDIASRCSRSDPGPCCSLHHCHTTRTWTTFVSTQTVSKYVRRAESK